MNTIKTLFNQQIIKAFEDGIIPWELQWNNHLNAGLPRNPVSRKKYHGSDVLLLQISSEKKSFHSKWWATAPTWLSLGFNVNHCPGTPTIHDIYYNAEQVDGEGIGNYLVDSLPLTPNIIDLDYRIADVVIKLSKAKIIHGGERAFYTRNTDVITLPPIEQFGDPSEYYYAAFHELIHWSETRLGWPVERFGEPMSELIAEMGSGYLMADTHLPMRQPMNRKKYMPQWLDCMKKDENWIFNAAQQASRAASYVYSLTSQH